MKDTSSTKYEQFFDDATLGIPPDKEPKEQHNADLNGEVRHKENVNCRLVSAEWRRN